MSACQHYFSFWGGATIGFLIDVEGSTPNLADSDHNGETMNVDLIDEVDEDADESVIFAILKNEAVFSEANNGPSTIV